VSELSGIVTRTEQSVVQSSDPVRSRAGWELRQLRELRGLTLRDVSSETDISPAYLLKLERGEVQSPSPHVLKRIAGFYGVSYLALMELAGYSTTETDETERRPALVAGFLAAESLTESEQRAVSAFLSTLRSQGTRI
jgi:transcriptional regulator with XRE-family HTH domain